MRVHKGVGRPPDEGTGGENPRRLDRMRRAAGFIVLVLLIAPAAAIAASAADAPPPAPTLVTGVLPVAPSAGAPANQDAEPGLAVAGDGTFWIASDIAPFAADDKRIDPVGVLSGAG